MDEPTLRKLRSKLDKALAANEHEEAIRLLTKLSAADTANARWPHKQGDLLRKLERYRDAALAYAAAADLYAEQGFLSRAVAVAKTVANLDPRRLDVLERIDPDAAKQFKRNLRPPTQPLRQAPARAGEPASGAGAPRARPVTAAMSGDAGARPSRVDPAPPVRPAPPEGFRQRVTMQGFAGGPVARAPDAAGANSPGAARPTTAKTGPVQGPARQAGIDSPPRGPADQVRSVAGAPADSSASRTTQPLPAVPVRLTMPGRKHPMVLDDDEPVPGPPVRPSQQRVAEKRVPSRVQPPAPRPNTSSNRVFNRHPMVSDDREPVAAPAPPVQPHQPHQPQANRISARVEPPPSQQAAPHAPARVEPPAPRPDASSNEVSNPPSEDDEIIVVILDDDDEPEPASEVAPAVAEERPQPSAAPAPTPASASTPAPRAVSLDRLSLPPPRPGRAAAADGAAATDSAAATDRATAHGGAESTLPSPLPARPARAIELAPPAELGDAEALELPTGKFTPLQSARPARRRSEPKLRAAGGGPEPRASGAVEARSLEAEWSAESAEEFSRALEAAAPASMMPRAPVGADAASSVDVRDALLQLPLFAKLDAQTLDELAAGSALIEPSDGATVVSRGEVGDSLYGILRGSATISGPERSYELELVEGDLFGEACVLKQEPCRADVRVAGRLHALKIPRAGLARLLKRKPRVADQLLGLLTSRLRLALLAGSPLFRELDPESRQELGARFEVRRASASSRLAEQDAPIDGLYVLLTGQLTVEKSGFVTKVAPALSLFGHQLLVSSKRSPSTITARRNVVLLRLSPSNFGEVALKFPRFAARLAKHVSSDVVPLD